MQKKIIALAVAGLVSGAAFAQTNVTIYGQMDMAYERSSTNDATAANTGVSRNNINGQTNVIGFKGEESLGNGLAAVWQVETQVLGDARAGAAGATNLGGRNTGLGLRSATMGTVMLGSWDSPYKANAVYDVTGTGGRTYSLAGSLMGNQTATDTSVTAAGGYGTSFDRRVANSVQYWSPVWSGFQGKLMYGANETKTNTGAATDNSGNLWAGSVSYMNGPLAVNLSYEQHNDYRSVVAGSESNDDDAWRIAAAYTIGKVKLGLGYEKIDFDNKNLATAWANADKSTWTATAHWNIVGAHNVFGGYTSARGDNVGRTAANVGGNDESSKQIMLGYGYNLSKRTSLYAVYSKISNDDAATGAMLINNTFASGNAAIGAGQNTSVTSVGMKHTF